MTRIRRLGFTLSMFSLFLGSVAFAAEVIDVRVETVAGGAVEQESVLAYTSIEVGQDFDRRAVARDVKALQKTGRFAFVGVAVDPVAGGVVVIYQVQNKPRLRRIEIEGADYMRASKVRKMIDLEPGDPVDDTALALEVQKVEEKYRKRYFPYVKTKWFVEPVGDGDDSDVRIVIDEGDRAKIRRIHFKGNGAASERELRKVMKQRKSNPLSFITKAGTYNPDELDVDRYALRRFYLNKGYLDVQIGEPEIKPRGRHGLTITIPVTEGQPYTVGAVRIENNELFPEKDLRVVVRTQEGSVASLEEIERSAQALRDYYGSRGYIRTQVKELIDADPATHRASLAFRITEGSLTFIRNIQVKGNVRTKDKVIRRELAIYPGEIFNEVKVRRSERRLQNLNYFSTVFSSPTPTSEDDQYDLTFEVEEKRTGQFVVGAGFSSIDDLIGFAEVSQGNFDIKNPPGFTGGGQKLKLRTQLGTSRTDIEFSFTEPWFLDRRLSLGVSFFRNERRFLSNDYDQRNTGGSVSLGKSLGGPNRIKLAYTIENIEVFHVDSDASDLIKEEEGSRTKSSLRTDLIHDTRDNFFIPTRGNRSSLGGELAGGPLGADTDLYKLEARSSQFWPLWFDHVFNIRGHAATVEEYGNSTRVPIFDRLFLGGARTLRGFDYRDVGPKDETGEPIGGNSSWFATAEYTVPLFSKVRAAGFYDIGQVALDSFDLEFNDYNSDAGFGVRLDLPAFPLRLDYAWPLEADEVNDNGGQFNFLLGYVF